MSTSRSPEVWLRGPVEGIPPGLQPVAHSLLQAREDLENLSSALSPEECWTSPGGAAPVGFHLRHLAGSLDRLFTYARGERLSESQLAALSVEKQVTPKVSPEDLLETVQAVMEQALEQLGRTGEEELDQARTVGRAGLPSSVRGLLYHGAEHTTRHVGQVITTLKVVRGLRGER